MRLTFPLMFSAWALALIGQAAAPPCPDVQSLLSALERTGATIESFSSNLVYESYDSFAEQNERRFGRLVLASTSRERTIPIRVGSFELALRFPSRERSFAILFNRFIDASGKETSSDDRFLYAAGWLAEINAKERTFVKRQIVAPGQDFDPLRLGEGPIPLPFGQASAEVLARFRVEPCEKSTSEMLQKLQGVCGLTLIPKPGTRFDEDTAALEVFYDSTTLALRGVNLIKKNGDRTTVLLPKPVMNAPLIADDTALLVMPNPDPAQWQVDIRPWNDAGGNRPAADRRGNPFKVENPADAR